MVFTKKDLDILLLKIQNPNADEFIDVDVDKQTEEVVINIDSNNDADLLIRTKDSYLKYRFYTSNCIEELRFLTRDNTCYSFSTVWNEEHDNYNTYEYVTNLDGEITDLVICKLKEV